MPKTITVRMSPVLLDQLLAAEFGPTVGRSLLGETFDLNPGLANAGPVIPIGRAVVLPDPPAPSTTAERRPVSLFG